MGNTNHGPPRWHVMRDSGYQIRHTHGTILCSLPTTMSVPAPNNSDPETKPTESTPTEQAPVDADKEPQNALTQKFTDKEWAALKEFRVRAIKSRSTRHFRHICRIFFFQSLLPDILEKAYDGREGSRTTSIVIWGVTLDPSGNKDARASVVLMKWLRARYVLLKCICVNLVHGLMYVAKKLERERRKGDDDRHTSLARGVQD
jgi:hypothetical protein